MAYPFGPWPFLEQVIERAIELDCRHEVSPELDSGPRGPVRFEYLVRETVDRKFVKALPGPEYVSRVAPTIVAEIALGLGLKPMDFPPFWHPDDTAN